VVADFRALDTEPFGVNPDNAPSHQAFIDALDLPFDLLVDEGAATAAAYGARKPDGSGIARTVVVIGKDGRVLYRAAGAPAQADVLDAIRAATDDGVLPTT